MAAEFVLNEAASQSGLRSFTTRRPTARVWPTISKKALGDKVQVVYYGGIIQRDPDYKAVLTSIKETKPELYFFGGIYPEAGRLVRQAKEIGLNIPMVTGDGVFDPTFINIAGKSAEGTYVTFGKEPAGMSSAKTFLEHYKAKYGEPGPYSIYAYDAANIILTAIEQTGSTDGDKAGGLYCKDHLPRGFRRYFLRQERRRDQGALCHLAGQGREVRGSAVNSIAMKHDRKLKNAISLKSSQLAFCNSFTSCSPNSS